MKSKYYLGKALKKMGNYKSPYREYFEEISSFIQFSLDFFKGKREKSNFNDEKLRKSGILEENEEDYDEKQEILRKNEENTDKRPKLVKNDYNIYINNIVFTKEIKKSKKKLINYEEKTAKISQNFRKENFLDLMKKNEIKKAFVIECEKKCEITNKTLDYRENFAKIEKRLNFIEKFEEKEGIFVENQIKGPFSPLNVMKTEENEVKTEENVVKTEEILPEFENIDETPIKPDIYTDFCDEKMIKSVFSKPGLSSIVLKAFTQEIGQIKDFLADFHEKYADFDYSSFEKQLFVSPGSFYSRFSLKNPFFSIKKKKKRVFLKKISKKRK